MTQDAVVRRSTWSRCVFSLIRKTRFEPAVVAVLICLAVPMLILAADNPDSTAIGTRTVTGLVRDIACPLQNKKSTTTAYSKECIAMCAKSGSPMGILTEDGSVYVPVTESMPDTGQEALKPFIGEHVQATGKVFERNGGHAIAISEIHKLPSAAAGQ
jgi:hypothetical protein